MQHFINRDYRRNESDDFKLNVQSYIKAFGESVPQHDENGNLVGWMLQERFA